MLTQIEVINDQGESLLLPLQDASSGYLVKKFEGLGPVKADVISTKFAQLDGTQHQASKRGERNIVGTIGFVSDWINNSVESLRDELYTYLMPKAIITLNFYRDGAKFATCQGIVESNEPPLFAQEPAADVSILCTDPDFYALVPIVVAGNTVSTTATQTIVYSGTIEAGVVIQVNVNRAMSGFSIYNTRPDNSIQVFDVVADLIAGDVVTINTNDRQKKARRLRAAVDTSLLSAVSPTATWIKLARGNNLLRVYATGAAVPFTVTYLPKYGGL